MRHKGELSPADVDRGWPHQVALPAGLSQGGGYVTIHYFCEGLSLCRRGHTVVNPHDNEWWIVYCFAERAHAEQFKARFGGEWFDPTKRGKGRNWAYWERP